MTDEVYQFNEEFRNSIATVDGQGKRVWIYPKKPSGSFHRWRVAVTVLLLTILFAGPFLRIGGQPFLLLNVFERKFVILGQAFWPQDFVLLALILLAFFIFIIVFTLAFGRVWCGWMCPQTLFMEMVFRKIEYWIEGDAPAQRRLNAAPLSFGKVWKKTAKHAIFIVISVIIAHTVMAYMIGTDQTLAIIGQSPLDNLAGFSGLAAFTVIFYGVYARFREQACIAVCPYGRLQSVLLTKESIVVAYDWLRGEPRGQLRKKHTVEAPKGDCVDCKLCVHVCPTGIDIRNGTQLECVNCTACIDACDDVMLKVNKPTGLIRYASASAIEKGSTKIFTPRLMVYSGVLLVIIALLGFTLATRSDVETTVLKVPGTLYQKPGDGYISNLYNVEFINKSFDDVPVTVRVESPSFAKLQKVDGKNILLPAEGLLKTVFFIRIPEDEIKTARTVVYLGIYHRDTGKLLGNAKVKFIGPVRSSADVNSRLKDEQSH
ncbi:cytochrome c oxidase accessory protein CcoG [Dawidia soli]|uniref:Cytochrome c oxidase accessory protein CcoG n=1 Tax=Dawidia soli TaxID=2782352 RepID=A0AAP2DDB2_9BACT|nr:cytochrome c oxidase accessory protein CcoG [Dawidia soli]MBT1689066.1 cytochrome c oxidase accessory protein CcoG [Dawidia soli]